TGIRASSDAAPPASARRACRAAGAAPRFATAPRGRSGWRPCSASRRRRALALDEAVELAARRALDRAAIGRQPAEQPARRAQRLAAPGSERELVDLPHDLVVPERERRPGPVVHPAPAPVEV